MVRSLRNRLLITLTCTLLLPAVPIFAVLAGFSGAGYVIAGSTMVQGQATGFSVAWNAYLVIMTNLVSGDFGTSLSYGVPVISLLGKAWANSAPIIIYAFLFAYMAGAGVSLLSALQRKVFGPVQNAYAFLASIPFIVYLTIAPRDLLAHPVAAQLIAGCSLGIYPSLSVSRTISARIRDLQTAPFICALHSFGFNEYSIWFRMAIRPVAFDAIALGESVLAFVFGFLFFAEAAIGVQGLGAIFVSATKRFDYPVIIGCCIIVLWLLFVYGVIVECFARLVPTLNRGANRWSNNHV